MTLAILFAAALGSSMISGLLGMAGGVTLLAVMTFIYPLPLIVPLHGAVQFASNSSRTFMLRKSVRVSGFVYFLAAAPLGAAAAYFILKQFSQMEEGIYLVVALLFYTSLKPRKMPDIKLSDKGYFLLGLAATTLGPLIGATGPLLAPFFARDDYSKEEIVATKAACQIVIHLLKFPIFYHLAFPYKDYALIILVMVFAVILGTRAGVFLLGRISAERFKILLKIALFLTGVRLCLKILA